MAPRPSQVSMGKKPMTAAPPPSNNKGKGKSTAPPTQPAASRPHTHTSPNHTALATPSINPSSPTANLNPNIWSTSTTEKRERIKEFWLGLSELERRELVRIEKDTVLRKMKEQQRHACGCAVCGRKRSAIEEELQVLYDAYYEELEQYAAYQRQGKDTPGPGPFPGSVALEDESYVNAARDKGRGRVPGTPQVPPQPPAKQKQPPKQKYEDDYEDDDEEEEEEEEEGDEEAEEDPHTHPHPHVHPHPHQHPTPSQPNGNNTKRPFPAPSAFSPLSISAAAPGNILTVADDLLQNDGQKFLEMMEQLAERRMQREDEAVGMIESDESEDDSGDEDVDSEEEEEDEEDSEDEDDSEEDEEDDDEEMLTDEQKMEEGKRMFSIFAARMFEQRVLTAYLEKVAQERQLQLLRELEDEDKMKEEREMKKLREKEKKKAKKTAQKEKKEMAQKKKEDAEKEKKDKAEEERRMREERDREKREQERERREKEKKEREERERVEKERREERELKERERKEKEKERREKEERDRKEKDEHERKEKEEKEKEEKLKKERELREQREKEQREKEREEKERKEKGIAIAAANQKLLQQQQVNGKKRPAPLPTASTSKPTPIAQVPLRRPSVPILPSSKPPATPMTPVSARLPPKPTTILPPTPSTSKVLPVVKPITPQPILPSTMSPAPPKTPRTPSGRISPQLGSSALVGDDDEVITIRPRRGVAAIGVGAIGTPVTAPIAPIGRSVNTNGVGVIGPPTPRMQQQQTPIGSPWGGGGNWPYQGQQQQGAQGRW